MAYEDSAGLNVSNHYGPRTSGGSQGVHKTEGFENEYVVDGASQGLPYLFPRGGGVFVYKIDMTYVIGTVTDITIGGLSVMDATEEAPIKIPYNNTGEVVVTGLTGGRLVIYFKKSAGYEPDIYPAFPSTGTTPVVSVTTTPAALSVAVGGTAQVSSVVAPSGADQDVAYSTSDAAIATVSPSGVVTGVAAGSATITATSVGDNTKTDTVAVTVTA